MRRPISHPWISARWIIGAREDLTWFIGPAMLCYGLAAIVNRRLILYAAVVFGYAMLFNLSRRGVIAAFGESGIITETFLAISIGPLLAHFYLDSVIWRVRRNPEVGRALDVNEPVDLGRAAAA